jgi:outer membrane protein assembly factor BamB
MRSFGNRFLQMSVLVVVGLVNGWSGDWPRFRGPNGSGVSACKGLPVEFSQFKNLAWKTAVPSGVSSPVLMADRVFVTAADGNKRLVMCLDSRTGKRTWERSIEVTSTHHRHPLNDPASPTPLADGSSVYAFFPDYGIVAYDLAGTEKWKTPLGPLVSLHGVAASPVLTGESIVLLADQARGSFLAAFHRKDGRQLWRTERPDAAGGYSTPVVYSPPGRVSQIVVSSPRELASYSAQTGEKLWWVGRMGEQPQTSPINWRDMVFAVGTGGAETWEGEEVFRQLDINRDGFVDAHEFPESWGPIAGTVLDANGDGKLSLAEWKAFGARIHGGGPSALVAVGLEGRGDITETGVSWRFSKALPALASPLIYSDILYLVKGGGVITALDPRTGLILKQGRVVGAEEEVFASPVAGDGKIYITTVTGKVAVLKTGPDWTPLAVNDLGEECYASPAIGDRRVYIRTRNAVYAFANSQ